LPKFDVGRELLQKHIYKVLKYKNTNPEPSLRRLIKYLFIIVFILFLGLIAYSYLADLSPSQEKIQLPVILNAG